MNRLIYNTTYRVVSYCRRGRMRLYYGSSINRTSVNIDGSMERKIKVV